MRYGRKRYQSNNEPHSEPIKLDKETDQLSIFDPRDPFTGGK